MAMTMTKRTKMIMAAIVIRLRSHFQFLQMLAFFLIYCHKLLKIYFLLDMVSDIPILLPLIMEPSLPNAQLIQFKSDLPPKIIIPHTIILSLRLNGLI